ncbi:hypothetical protein BDP27DRAFT_1434325 [Rhodocollybia butyracea]|uniref:Uncharacterized protein n=1 Tax=Rhodocollybia butyracea TaxID=206335 RepID=A0A9P5TWE3_9AGAR|nr:hypothetical protein BDP27DRAFT_1434325 [Rhodocollybia butyracea]
MTSLIAICIEVEVIYTYPYLVNKTSQQLSNIIVNALKFPQPRKQSIRVESDGRVLKFGWITSIRKPFLGVMKDKFGTHPLTPQNLALLHIQVIRLYYGFGQSPDLELCWVNSSTQGSTSSHPPASPLFSGPSSSLLPPNGGTKLRLSDPARVHALIIPSNSGRNPPLSTSPALASTIPPAPTTRRLRSGRILSSTGQNVPPPTSASGNELSGTASTSVPRQPRFPSGPIPNSHPLPVSSSGNLSSVVGPSQFGARPTATGFNAQTTTPIPASSSVPTSSTSAYGPNPTSASPSAVNQLPRRPGSSGALTGSGPQADGSSRPLRLTRSRYANETKGVLRPSIPAKVESPPTSLATTPSPATPPLPNHLRYLLGQTTDDTSPSIPAKVEPPTPISLATAPSPATPPLPTHSVAGIKRPHDTTHSSASAPGSEEPPAKRAKLFGQTDPTTNEASVSELLTQYQNERKLRMSAELQVQQLTKDKDALQKHHTYPGQGALLNRIAGLETKNALLQRGLEEAQQAAFANKTRDAQVQTLQKALQTQQGRVLSFESEAQRLKAEVDAKSKELDDLRAELRYREEKLYREIDDLQADLHREKTLRREMEESHLLALAAKQRELDDLRVELDRGQALPRDMEAANLSNLEAKDLALDNIRAELKREQALRREMEGVVEDLRREFKSPFLVPSMVELLMEISKLTTRTKMSMELQAVGG